MGDKHRNCLPCQKGYESIRHLFLHCEYTRAILLVIAETLARSINLEDFQLSHPHHPLHMHQNRESYRGLSKVHYGPCWGVHWNNLDSTKWHIWAERNRRLRNHIHQIFEQERLQGTQACHLSMSSIRKVALQQNYKS